MSIQRLICACVLSAALPAFAEVVLPDVPGAPSTPAPAPAPPPVKKADPFGDRVRFAGGDSLRGALASFDAKTGLAWKHKDGLATFQFRPDSLDRIDLAGFAPKAEAVDLRLTLGNGDTLLGRLVEFTPQKVTLDTWYAGRLSVATAAVRSLAPIKNGQQMVLSGFGKANDWKVQNGRLDQVRIRDGEMILTNGVWAGRELELPPVYKVDIEVAGAVPNFMVAVMADNVQFYGGNSFMVQINATNGWVQRNIARGNNNNRNEGVGNFRVQPREGRTLLSLGVDNDAHLLSVFVNGRRVNTVAIPADFKPGKHVVLAGQNGAARFTKIRVGAWSGQGDDATAPAKRPAHDTMVLANKDQMSGQLLGVKDGKASFKAEFATMEVPLDRIRNFDLAAVAGAPPVKAEKGSVQLFFDDTSRLTLALEGIKDGKLAGTSAAFGACAADLAAFQKVVFNLDASFRAEAQPTDGAEEAQDGGEEQ